MANGAESHDVYFVLHPFSDNVREFRILMRPLGDLDIRYLAGAEGYYRNDLDTAMVVLRFTQRAHQRLGDMVVNLLCSRSGLPIVIPERLTPAERRTFFLEHLSGYTTYVQLYPGGDPLPLAERVLVHLEEHLGPRRASTGEPTFFDVEANLPIANPRRGKDQRSTP